MAELKTLMRIRRTKRDALRRAGKDPYPETTPNHIGISELFDTFDSRARLGRSVAIAGRITGLRGHGGVIFLDVQDSNRKLQALLNKDSLGEKEFSLAAELDLGDFVFVQGSPKRTKRGEPTIFVKKYLVLTKSLRPLPGQWYGLHDVEERFRSREVDLVFNPQVRERFVLRSKLSEAIRRGLSSEGFLEVETPMLQTISGGANAEPFKTTLRALRMPLYLRIAPELYLKRLLVGGFERVYELGRVFRNEGMDQTHNPEFTMLEFYWAYQDRAGLLSFTEKFMRRIVHATKGELLVHFREKILDFRKPFLQVVFDEVFTSSVGCTPDPLDERKLRSAAKRLGIEDDSIKLPPLALIDKLFKKAVLPTLQQPTFVLYHPLGLSPLAKSSKEHPRSASRFQFVAGGLELINAYAELNDPDEQRKRFSGERKRKQEGDREAQRLDETFIVSLEYGMPPAAGFGLGVDRFLMLLTDAPSLREVILFPTMRPKRKN